MWYGCLFFLILFFLCFKVQFWNFFVGNKWVFVIVNYMSYIFICSYVYVMLFILVIYNVYIQCFGVDLLVYKDNEYVYVKYVLMRINKKC